MKVYKVVQKSWNDGQVSDFDLPKTLGYYTTESKAQYKADDHRLVLSASHSNGLYYTTREDYAVYTIEVE